MNSMLKCYPAGQGIRSTEVYQNKQTSHSHAETDPLRSSNDSHLKISPPFVYLFLHSSQLEQESNFVELQLTTT